MEEKKNRTFGEFLKDNKGKIIKGLFVVGGVVVGAVAMKLLTPPSEELCLDVLENVDPEEVADVVETVSDVTDTIC